MKILHVSKKKTVLLRGDYKLWLQIGVACPTLYMADQEQHLLIMQQLEGKTAREAVDQGIADGDVKQLSRIAKLIGEQLVGTPCM